MRASWLDGRRATCVLAVAPARCRCHANRWYHHPKGVVGVISPWNYPLVLGASDADRGAARWQRRRAEAGQPGTAHRGLGRRSRSRAGLPEQLWQLVLGDGPTVGGAIVDNIDYLCFTGSTRTGRSVAQRAAHRLIGASLELGGKNPMLVLHDADIGRAGRAPSAHASRRPGSCVSRRSGSTSTSGVRDSFVSCLVDRVGAMRIGPGSDWPSIWDRWCRSATRHRRRSRRRCRRRRVRAFSPVVRARPDLGPYFMSPRSLTVSPRTWSCAARRPSGQWSG